MQDAFFPPHVSSTREIFFRIHQEKLDELLEVNSPKLFLDPVEFLTLRLVHALAVVVQLLSPV